MGSCYLFAHILQAGYIWTLIHWSRDEIDTILQTAFSNAFSLMKIYQFQVKFPKGPINSIPALVQIMAWCWPSHKPLSEPMMIILLIRIYFTLLQWVNNHMHGILQLTGIVCKIIYFIWSNAFWLVKQPISHLIWRSIMFDMISI